MTVHQLLETLQALLTEQRDELADVIAAEPQDNDWIMVTFSDGNELAVTVEELQ